MADITAQEFQQDVNNASEWANGDENTTVTMRLGQQARSPAKVIADIQADFNATQSGELTAQAVDAADRAETAADSIQLLSNNAPYDDAAAGLAGTTDGGYFSVVSASDEGYLDLYKNESNVAVFKKSYPSKQAIAKIEDEQYITDYSNVYRKLGREKSSLSSAPMAVVAVLLGQSLNAARGSIAQTSSNDNVKMFSAGCHVSSFDYWSSNKEWAIEYDETLSTSTLAEGGDGQSPCSGIGNSVLGGSVKRAYIGSVAVGSRDIEVIASGGLRANLHAFVERLCSIARQDGYAPKVVFYSAHGEADAFINNANYEQQALKYYQDCQLLAAQVMRDCDYRAPVILTYPMQSSIAGNWDQKIANDISSIAKKLVNGIDAGSLYQWEMEVDRVHPTPGAYVKRGEFIGKLIREFFSNNYKRDTLEITDATWNGSTVNVVFSDDVVRDDTNIAGTALNTGVALDGFEVLQGGAYVPITSAAYNNSVVTLTTDSALSGAVLVRIANQETTSTTAAGIEWNIGSQVRSKYDGFGSIFEPTHKNHVWAKRQEITVRGI